MCLLDLGCWECRAQQWLGWNSHQVSIVSVRYSPAAVNAAELASPSRLPRASLQIPMPPASHHHHHLLSLDDPLRPASFHCADRSMPFLLCNSCTNIYNRSFVHRPHRSFWYAVEAIGPIPFGVSLFAWLGRLRFSSRLITPTLTPRSFILI